MTELSPEAKKLLRIAREEYSPADQRVMAVRSALDARIAPVRGSGEGGAGGASPAAAAALNIPRLLGFGLLAVALAGATVIGVRRSVAPTRAIGTAVPAALPQSIAAPAQVVRDEPTAQQGDDVRDSARVPAPAAAAAAARKSNAPAPAPEQLATEPLRRAEAAPSPRAPRVQHARAPSARSAARVDRARSSTALALGSQQAPDREAPAQAVATVDREQAPAAPEPNKVVDDSLAREIALLKRARAALDRNDPRAALAFTDEHAEQFASGVMRQERLATRVLALCALQRRAEATAAKRELERIAPRSPHLMRLRTSCAAEPEAREVK